MKLKQILLLICCFLAALSFVVMARVFSICYMETQNILFSICSAFVRQMAYGIMALGSVAIMEGIDVDKTTD